MNKSAKFKSFLESMKSTNPALIESIQKGFEACFEGVKKEMDHSGYMKKLTNEKNFPDSSLKYIKEDAKKAMEAMPDGPNVGYYEDEIHYCTMELARRKKEREKKKVVTEAYEDYNTPDEDSIPSDYTDELPILDTSDPEHVEEGDIVKYKNRDGSILKGKVVHLFTSTSGKKAVSIDSFSNSYPITALITVIRKSPDSVMESTEESKFNYALVNKASGNWLTCHKTKELAEKAFNKLNNRQKEMFEIKSGNYKLK